MHDVRFRDFVDLSNVSVAMTWTERWKRSRRMTLAALSPKPGRVLRQKVSEAVKARIVIIPPGKAVSHYGGSKILFLWFSDCSRCAIASQGYAMCDSTKFVRIDSAHLIWRIGILARSPSLPCWNFLVRSIRGPEREREWGKGWCRWKGDLHKSCGQPKSTLRHVEWRVRVAHLFPRKATIPAIRLQHGEQRSSIRRMRHASLSSPTRLLRMRSSRAGKGYRCSLGSLDQPVHPG